MLAAVIVPRNELQQAGAKPVLELELGVVAASHSASAIEAALEPGPETGPGAAAGSAVAVGAAAVGLEAAVGFGADSEFEFVPAEGEPRAVEAVPGHSTVSSGCPAPDMVTASTPSGLAAVVAPVVLVVTEAVIGAAAIGIVLPHKRHFDLDWCVRQDAAVYRRAWHQGTRYISSGHMCSCSTRKPAAGRQADHNQGLAVREHATRGAGTKTAVVERLGAAARRLSKYQHQRIEKNGKNGSLHSL